MAVGSGYKVWGGLLRFEKTEEDDYIYLEINDENRSNLLNIKCNGADAELLDVGAGEGGKDQVELVVKLDPIQNHDQIVIQPNENVVPYYQDVKVNNFNVPSPPNTSYRTSSVEFLDDNAPVVKLYCIDNYNWELHINSYSENIYRVYNYNLKVDGDTDDCSITMKEGQTYKPICMFKKRFFSLSSAKVEFQSEVSMPTLKLLMTVLAYFRYSGYGYNVTIEGTDPNTFNSKEYKEELKQRKRQRQRREKAAYKNMYSNN